MAHVFQVKKMLTSLKSCRHQGEILGYAQGWERRRTTNILTHPLYDERTVAGLSVVQRSMFGTVEGNMNSIRLLARSSSVLA